jgi:CRISPR-associated protein Csn2
MKLVNTRIGIELDLPENNVGVFVVESPAVLSGLMQELRCAVSTGESEWVLSDSNGILQMEKVADLVIDPWSLDLNGKWIKSKLVHYLTGMAQDMYYEDFLKTRGQLFQYIELISEASSYPLSYNEEFENADLLKWLDVRLDVEAETFLERLVEYVKILGSLCGIRVVFFWGLHAILSSDELQLLYREASYQKVSLVLIESQQGQVLEGEKYTIIDSDCCVISF